MKNLLARVEEELDFLDMFTLNRNIPKSYVDEQFETCLNLTKNIQNPLLRKWYQHKAKIIYKNRR